VPETVTIEGGRQSATFTYKHDDATASVTVTATLGTSTREATVTVATAISGLVINEVDYDQEDADAAEFIEIYNGSGAPVDLTGHALVLVNGANNTAAVYDTLDLSEAGTIAAGQYVVVGSTSVMVPEGVVKIPFTPEDRQSNRVQNGAPDGIALVNLTTGAVLDALSYEGAVAPVMIADASVNLVEGTALQSSVADRNEGVGSLCRVPDGADTNQAADDWTFCGTITPGAANAAP
jgi:hypothetical protein